MTEVKAATLPAAMLEQGDTQREGSRMRLRAPMSAALALALAAGGAAAQPPEPVGPKLPDKLRELLLREMNAIEDAGLEVQRALVRGDDARVAELAQKIHDSFILRQEMTDEDRQALRAAVPLPFIERDQEFHALTGELAEAAREADAERQRDLFGEVVSACAACHELYAKNRFPGFGSE